MSGTCIAKGFDGFYHPATEHELADLVRHACESGCQIRVRGSVHSVARAIYTDRVTEAENRVHRQTPPSGRHINVMLDRLRGWHVVDECRRLIEVRAGTHLGANPSDPAGCGGEEDGLLYQLWDQRRWTLTNLGGITHQTISGFVATGSAGASIRHGFHEDLYGFRIVDGHGGIREVTRNGPQVDLFHALAPSMGLLGIIVAVQLRCVPAFLVAGEERYTTWDDCPIDLFGEDAERPGLEDWLRSTEFGRLEWWPQRGGGRIELWQGWRLPDESGFRPRPYRQFGERPVLEQFGCCLFLTVTGNLHDLAEARRKLRPATARVGQAMGERLRGAGVPKPMAAGLGRAFGWGLRMATEGLVLALTPFGDRIAPRVPWLFLRALDLFVPLDRGEGKLFHDHSWRALPMDREVDDALLGVDFTEAWVPVQHSQAVLRLLRDYFSEPDKDLDALGRTGSLPWELYAAPPSPFWMSPAYSDGSEQCPWKDGVLRIDPFWFAGNPGNPAEDYFPPFWELLRGSGIPFRLHWGKHQPVKSDDVDWPAFFRSQYPRWDDFLDLRQRMDPDGVFLNEYWRDRFGLPPASAGPGARPVSGAARP